MHRDSAASFQLHPSAACSAVRFAGSMSNLGSQQAEIKYDPNKGPGWPWPFYVKTTNETWPLYQPSDTGQSAAAKEMTKSSNGQFFAVPAGTKVGTCGNHATSITAALMNLLALQGVSKTTVMGHGFVAQVSRAKPWSVTLKLRKHP